MKYIQYAALCAGLAYVTLQPADTPSPDTVYKHTQGDAFIKIVTSRLQTADKLNVMGTFQELIKPHYTNFWTLIQKRRSQEDEPELSLEEFFTHIFPTPLSKDWNTTAIQLWIFYTTYLLIENPDVTSASLSEDIRHAISRYITKYHLVDWVWDTIDPLVPGIVHYYMIPRFPLPPLPEHTECERRSEGSTSIASESETTDEEGAYCLKR
jgi:hypothetical protein